MSHIRRAFSMKLQHNGEDIAWCRTAPLTQNPVAKLGRLGRADRRRAEAFRREQRLAEFVTARLLLQDLLEAAFHVAPESWAVDSADGPPTLSGWPDSEPPAVSLSHAAGWSAAAAGRVNHIGVDLEAIGRQVRGIPAYLDWPISPRGEEFTLAWTLWEATAKAVQGGVFRRNNEGFAALVGPFVEADGSLTVANGWLAVSHPLTASLRITLVHSVESADGWEAVTSAA